MSYVCTVPEEYLKIAEDELRETESRRSQALEQLKELIQKDPLIEKYTISEWKIINFEF